MNQPIDIWPQGASFPQQQQQQQTTPQPIRFSALSALSNPTDYHLEAAQLRNQKQNQQNSSDGAPGAPPTPCNSYQSTNNSFSSNTIDPQILQLQYKQMQYPVNPIKHETEISHDMDFDQTAMSPQSHSPSGSSPPNQSLDTADNFGRSYKPTSHLDNLPPFEGSSVNSLYSLEPEFSYTEEFPMSAPTTTSAIGPMDVKTNMNNNNTKHFRQPNNNLGQLSMSLPVDMLATDNNEWYSTSFDQSSSCLDHPSSLQYPSTGEVQLMPASFDDAADSQKQALLYEKRRRRRESHNAVERRRRDNINEKIHELSTLLPDLYVDNSNKPNKGVILRKSVDYIRQLKVLYEQARDRNTKLETQVQKLKGGIPVDDIDNNPGSASSRSDLNNSSGGGHFG